MSIFKPSLIARSIDEIDGQVLQRAGIKGIILNWTKGERAEWGGFFRK